MFSFNDPAPDEYIIINYKEKETLNLNEKDRDNDQAVRYIVHEVHKLSKTN